MTTRAVLLNSSIFLADNNIRRNVASLSANYPTSVSTSTAYRTLNAGETWTFAPSPSTSSSILIVHTTGDVVADVTLNSIPSVRALSSVRLVLKQLLNLDDAVLQIVFQNTGTADVHLTIVQG